MSVPNKNNFHKTTYLTYYNELKLELERGNFVKLKCPYDAVSTIVIPNKSGVAIWNSEDQTISKYKDIGVYLEKGLGLEAGSKLQEVPKFVVIDPHELA